MAGNTLSGKVASVTYSYPGAIAPASSGGSVSIINRTTNIFLTGEDYAP